MEEKEIQDFAETPTTIIEQKKEELLALIEEKKYAELKNKILELNEVDIAELIGQIDNSETQVKVFRLIPKDIAAEVFVNTETEFQENIINKLTNSEIASIIADSFLDDVVDIIEEMPAVIVERLLSSASKEVREQINKLLSYPKDSAGSIMTIEFMDLKANMTVADCFVRIRKMGVDKETFDQCFITDSKKKLQGFISIQNLILANPEEVITNIMDTNIVSVTTNTDQEEVSNIFTKYHINTLPVVDSESRLVGIITGDDIVEVIHEEATEDFHKIAAIVPNPDPYLKTSVLKHSAGRVIWLLLLMISSIFTGLLLTSYEEAFILIPALVSFIPMLMNTAGNCGSQTSILIIRGMALGEIKLKDFFKVLFKEARVSLIIGLILTFFNIIRIYLQYNDWMLGLGVGLSLYIAIIIANLLGFMLPMLFKKMKLDPAIMSSSVLTTIMDITTIFVYFTIAKAILGI